MPTGVLHLKEVDTDEITLDGTLSVSGAPKLKGAIVADSALSVGGAATFAADTATSNITVDGTLSISGQTFIGGDIIPDTTEAYDIGSPEFKIRDLYVSNNSIWVGDDMKISNDGEKLKIRKRKTNVVPKAIIEAGANAGHANEQVTADAALAHAGVANLSDMKLQHWLKFMRTMNRFAQINDIFRDNNDDYEDSSATDAWKEISGNSNKIYFQQTSEDVNHFVLTLGTNIVNGKKQFLINGADTPQLELQYGRTYTFEYDWRFLGTGSDHPFKLSTGSDGRHNQHAQYTDNQSTSRKGVIETMTFTVKYDTPQLLHYYCHFTSGMGNTIHINDPASSSSSGVGVGTSDPNANLHVKGSFKVESETGFQLVRSDVGGTDPTVVIDTHNFGTDETVNDLTGRGDAKYTKLYRVYGRNSEGVGRSWYWGYANDDYVNMSLAFDGGGAPDPDIAFTFTTASELYCNKVFAALGGNADTATLAAAATKLQTPRKINGVAFDGTKDITLSAGSGSSDVNLSVKELYVKNWVRSQGTGGHYWESGSTGHGYHIYPKNRADMYFRTGSGNGGICGTRENTTPRGYVHWTSSNEIGFLDQNRNWSIRCFQGGAQIYSDLYVNRVGYGNSMSYRIEKSGGDYMTVTTQGHRGNWGGYNIQNQWGIMAHTNGNVCGIYNDQDNKWAMYCNRNSHTRLHWNNSTKLLTESWGTRIYGDLELDKTNGYKIKEEIDRITIAQVTKEINQMMKLTFSFSDDRLKTNEKYITNATSTLLKLKPQIYSKRPDLIPDDITKTESGLIAQDIYYDAPELRHIVHHHDDAEIPEEKPFVDDDPTKDPDYSMWGSKPAKVDYMGLLPYLVRWVKENQEDIKTLNLKIATLESAA